LARYWAKLWVVPLSLFGLGLGGAMGPLNTAVLAQQSSNSESTSWPASISSGFKKGFDKLGQVIMPKSSTAVPWQDDDAISLKNNGKPGPGVNVAWARLSEQKGELDEAEKQYQLALKLKSDYLPALLGYAQLEEQLGHPQEAMKLYQQAAKMHPRQASVHNNAGLCYARQGQLDQAVAAINRAIELEPKNPLYRNNMAMVLVDKGMTREAFAQLREVHNEAEANYNLGFLLNKKGQTQAAFQHFMLALQSDPSMDAAKHWIDYLQKSNPQLRLSGQPASNGVKVVRQPAMAGEMDRPNYRDRDRPNYRAGENGTVPIEARPVPYEARTVPKSTINETFPPQNATMPQENITMPRGSAAFPPEESKPLRLPPVKSHRSETEGPALPGISYDTAPAAPLPPPTSNSALLQPLPRVR